MMFCAAQEQAIRTNWINEHTDKSSEIPSVECIVRGEKICNT